LSSECLGKLFIVFGTLLITCLLLTQEAFAADTKGQFAIRGAGLITCALYEKEREAKSEAYLMTAGWIDGYLTGSNQHASTTYDLTSFETTELLTAILAKYCKNNPKDRIFAVLNSLFKKLHQDRLKSLSKRVEISVGNRKASFYEEVVKRVQEKLASKGFYKGSINGSFGQESVNAMKAFQRSIKFDPTGFPDQMSLWKLLRSPN